MESVQEKMQFCYICGDKVPDKEAMRVKLTTGGWVYCHNECLELYMAEAAAAACAPSACSSCSSASSCSAASH